MMYLSASIATVLVWVTAASFCLNVAASAIVVGSCPPSLKNERYLKIYGNKCYRFEVNDRLEFQNAQDQCQAEGGNLAAVTSGDINEFLQKSIISDFGVYSSPVWIGLRHNSDGFRWVNGADNNTTYKNFRVSSTFSSEEECVAITPVTGFWRGFRCDASSVFFRGERNHFVCEYTLENATDSTAPNATSPTATVGTATPLQVLTVDDCPLTLKRDRYLTVFGRMCYRFEFFSYADYNRAQEHCQKEGGSLAKVASKEVNDFIYGQLSFSYIHYYKPIWIGLKYEVDEGLFEWRDGTNVSYSNFGDKDDHEGNRLCVALSSYSGDWATFECDKSNHSSLYLPKPFVCEYPAVPKPQKPFPVQVSGNLDGLCPTLDSQTKDYTNYFHVLNETCYFFQLGQILTFQNALEFCEKYEGTLAMVKSKAIENFLQNHLHNTHELGFFSDSLWIGLRFDPEHNAYRWVDGTPLEFSDFSYEQNYGECVGLIPWNGGWEDVHCHERAPYANPTKHFICQFDNSGPISNVTATPWNATSPAISTTMTSRTPAPETITETETTNEHVKTTPSFLPLSTTADNSIMTVTTNVTSATRDGNII